MSDNVQERLESTLPALVDLESKKIFTRKEIREIVRRRRDFEFRVISPGYSKADFLQYIAYETALESLRKLRCEKQGWKNQAVVATSGVPHLLQLFGRCVRIWPQDVTLWHQYIDFCLRSGSTKRILSILLQALGHHPRELSFWLLAAERELQLGHLEAPRRLMQIALRHLPNSSHLWIEYLQFEASSAFKLASARKSNSISAVPETIADEYEVLESNSNGVPESVRIQADDLVGVQHLSIIMKAATLKLHNNEELGEFLTSCLEVLSALLNSNTSSMLQGITEVGQTLTKLLIESQKRVPMIQFLLWKLQILNAVSQTPTKKLSLTDSLDQLLSKLKFLWSNMSSPVDAPPPPWSPKNCKVEAHKNANEPKDQSLPLSSQLLYLNQSKMQLQLLEGLICLLLNVAGIKEVSDSYSIVEQVGIIGVSKPNTEHVAEYQFWEQTTDSDFTQMLQKNKRLAISALLVPGDFFGTSEDTKTVTESASKERKMIWNALAEETDDDEMTTAFVLDAAGIQLMNADDKKRQLICSWVVDRVLSIDDLLTYDGFSIVPKIIQLIRNLLGHYPKELKLCLVSILNKVKEIPLSSTKEWSIGTALQRHMTQSDLEVSILHDETLDVETKRNRNNYDITHLLTFFKSFEIEKLPSPLLFQLIQFVKDRVWCTSDHISIRQCENTSITLQRLDDDDLRKSKHLQLIPLLDLIYRACSQENLMNVMRSISQHLLTHMNLIEFEWTRVMNNSYGYELIPIQREIIKRMLSLILISDILSQLISDILSQLLSNKNDQDQQFSRLMFVFEKIIQSSSDFDQSCESVGKENKMLQESLTNNLTTQFFILRYLSIGAGVEQLQILSEKPIDFKTPDDILKSFLPHFKLNVGLSRVACLHVTKIREQIALNFYVIEDIKNHLEGEMLTINQSMWSS